MGKPAKPKQIKDEGEAGKMLVDYLNKQNRPYNANDIGANLHDAIGKTVVVRVLASLAEKGEINERASGKQKIYFAKQGQFAKLSAEELNALDDAIESLKSQVGTIEGENSTLQTTLNGITAAPKTEEAERLLSGLRASNAAKEVKLQDLRENSGRITVKEKNEINAKYAQSVKEWRRRRRMALDMLDQILESYTESKASLFEEVGIETDEDVGMDNKTF